MTIEELLSAARDGIGRIGEHDPGQLYEFARETDQLSDESLIEIIKLMQSFPPYEEIEREERLNDLDAKDTGSVA